MLLLSLHIHTCLSGLAALSLFPPHQTHWHNFTKQKREDTACIDLQCMAIDTHVSELVVLVDVQTAVDLKAAVPRGHLLSLLTTPVVSANGE